MFQSFPRRFVPAADCQPSSKKLHRPKAATALGRLFWLVVALLCLPWLGSSAQAQTAEFTQNTKGRHAMTLPVPFANYPGRGINLPVTLHYSTQGLWRI